MEDLHTRPEWLPAHMYKRVTWVQVMPTWAEEKLLTTIGIGAMIPGLTVGVLAILRGIMLMLQ